MDILLFTYSVKICGDFVLPLSLPLYWYGEQLLSFVCTAICHDIYRHGLVVLVTRTQALWGHGRATS